MALKERGGSVVNSRAVFSGFWSKKSTTAQSSSTYRHGHGRHFLLHALEPPEARVHRLLQRSRRRERARVLRTEVLPEQRVIQVPAAVELQRPLQADDGGDVTGRRGGVQLLERAVQVRDVGVVVLGVVDLHGFGRDGRLQRRVVVGQIGKGDFTPGGGGGQVRGGQFGEFWVELRGADVCRGAEGGGDYWCGGHDGDGDGDGDGTISYYVVCVSVSWAWLYFVIEDSVSI